LAGRRNHPPTGRRRAGWWRRQRSAMLPTGSGAGRAPEAAANCNK